MTTPGGGNTSPNANAGAGAAANPWAEFGLNPDGTPVQPVEPKKEEPKQPDPGVAAENAALKAKVTELEGKISKLPDDFAGLSKKLDLVDRLTKAIAGDEGQDADSAAYQRVFSDLKEVARRTAPGLAKAIEILEKHPDAVDELSNQIGTLQASHVIALNEKAHDRVVDLARKAGFKGGSDAELNEMVFPFEQTMTLMINSNAELRKAFLSGNVGIVDQLFNRMIKPHVAQRLREKQSRLQSTLPKAPPRGAGTPGAQGEETPPKKDLSSPQGRANFHRNAVNRWLDKVSSRDE